MAFTTFSGPVRAGTQRYGDVTTINTGLPVLTQSATVQFGSMTTSPSAVNLFTLPAGAKIMGFMVEKTTAIAGGSVSAVNATFGKSGTANAFMTSAAIGLTWSLRRPTTSAPRTLLLRARSPLSTVTRLRVLLWSLSSTSSALTTAAKSRLIRNR